MKLPEHLSKSDHCMALIRASDVIGLVFRAAFSQALINSRRDSGKPVPYRLYVKESAFEQMKIMSIFKIQPNRRI